MNDAITSLYSRQLGGELPYFAGNPTQWGGGILQTIARFAFPILKRLVGVAANTAEDVIYHEKPFKQSLVDNAMNEVSNFIPSNQQKRRPINRKRKKDNFD
jgi:hypothetical protein